MLIAQLDTGLSIDRILTDADTNGDIYVEVVATASDSDGVILLWCSGNGGLDWTEVSRIRRARAAGLLRDCVFIVGHDSAGTWLFSPLIQGEAGSRSGLWLLRQRPELPDSEFLPILTGADTFGSLAAARGNGRPEKLHLTWSTSGGNIGYAGSTNCGRSWNDFRGFLPAHGNPTICVTEDSCVYVAAGRLDSAWISVASFADRPGSPDTVLARLDSLSGCRVCRASIAADRAALRSNRAVLVAYCHKDSASRVSPHSAWSRDGGTSWSTSIWPAVNQPRNTWDTRSFTIRSPGATHLFHAVASLFEAQTGRDSIIYAFTRSENPSYWEQRRTPANFAPDPAVAPGVGYSQAAGGGYVVYAPQGRSSLRFDCYALVGLTEQPSNPSPIEFSRTLFAGLSDPILRVSLSRPGPVRLRLFDCSGRQVSAVRTGVLTAGRHEFPVSAQHLPAGIYLGRLETTGSSTAFRLVQLK